MGRFDRYILSQLLRVFGFFSLVLVGVYWVNRSVLLLDQYLSEGQSGKLVLELTLLSLPSIMMIVLPIAGFVATAYATNRLYADSELVVVQATGFSAYRLARPFVTFGLAVALLMSVLAHGLVPSSVAQLNDLEADLAKSMSSRLLVPGTFQSPTKGVTVYARDVDLEGTLAGLLVSDRRNPNQETTYSAHSAILVRDPEDTKLLMFDGMAQTLEQPGNRLSITRFEDFTIAIGSLIADPGSSRQDFRELSTWAMLHPSEEIIASTRRDADYLKREAHLRITQALLSIGAAVLGFAALMTGGFSRFGLWRQIILAVLLVVLVKLIDNSAIDLAKNDPTLWPVVYASSILSGLICWFLLAFSNGAFRRKNRSTA